MIPSLAAVYKNYQNNDWFWLSLIFLSCFLVMLPMPLSGLPEGYDVAQHLRFAAAFRDAFLEGNLAPGWVGIDNYGFGAVGIRFYPPLADYILGITDIYFQSWFSSFIFNAFFWMFPGCFGMYFWAREFVIREQAAIAGVLFALMPYHVLQIYQYTLFSEFAAAAILPFCFWFLTRVITRGQLADVLFLAVSCSLFVLTHLPSIITGSIALCIYTFLLLDWKEFKETARRLMLAAVLTLSATSFYWLRLVTEVSWVKHNTEENWSAFFDFSRYLLPIIYSAPEKFYWERILWLLDVTALLTLLMLLPLVIYVMPGIRNDLADAGRKKVAMTLCVTGLFLILIMSFPAKIVWETLPVLHKIQFPWRFLSPVSMIAALSFAIGLPLLYKQYKNQRRLIGYSTIALISGVLIFNLAENILPMSPYSREDFEEKYAQMNTSEACDCWWPVWAKRAAFEQKEKVVADSRIVTILDWDRENRKFSVEEGEQGNARVATFWYPHWKARVNGMQVEVAKDENGAILIPIPSIRSEITLYFKEPVFLEAAKYVSLITWITLLFLLLSIYKQQRNQLHVV